MTAPPTLDVIAVGRASLELHAQQLGARVEHATSFAADLGGAAAGIALGLARLGLRVAMISRVGDDPAGRFATAALAAEGCDCARISVDRERPTQVALAAGPAVANAVRTDTADLAIDEASVDEAFLSTARALVITGRHAATAAGQRAVERARHRGVRTVLAIAQLPGPDAARRLQALLGSFDLVVGTRGELQLVGKSDELIQAVRQIRALTPAPVIASLGAAGCAIFDGDIPAREADARSVPAFAIEPVHGAGAGAGAGFVAGLVHAWLAGMDWREAGHRANACGALVAGRPTGAGALPTAVELAHFLANPPAPGGRPDRDPELARLHRLTPRRRQRDDLCLIAIDDRPEAFELARQAGASEARLGPLKQLLVRATAEAEQALGLHGRIGLLIDDTYGAEALRAAAGRGWWIARPVEVSGSSPLEFEGGRDVGSRLIEWPRGHVVSCVVRFHPDEPTLARLEQETQLAQLHHAAIASGHELLLAVVPPAHLPSEPDTIVRAIKRLYNIGIQPDWWGVAAMPAATWHQLDALIAERDRFCRGVLVLDRGEPDLAAAAASAWCRGGFIGTATLGASCAAWLAGTIDDQALIAQVGAAFEQRTAAWQRARRARTEAP